MIVRTCLLISDDPDDHIEFSEAIYEITDDTVLVTVANLNKAVELLSTGKCIPEYIFLNTSMVGFEPGTLFTSLEQPELMHIRIIAYGESRHVANSGQHRISAFIDTDIPYSELKRFLKGVLEGGR